MEKVVIDSKIKFVKDDIEDIVDKGQTVQEVTTSTSIVEITLSASNSYEFSSPAGTGMKVLKIVSDVPITMSYTSMQNTYDFGARFKEIQLVCNGEEEDMSSDWIARYGAVTITNTSAEDTAHIKIIFTH